MKVKYLSIQNLKSYTRTQIHLSPGINLLIGENNSGKTTIIRSLLNLQYRAFERKDIRSGQTSAKTLIKLSNVSAKDLQLFKNPRTHEPLRHHKNMDVFWHLGITPANTVVEENLFAGSNTISWRFGDEKPITKGSKLEKQYITFPLFPDMENKANYIFPFLAKRKTEYYDSNINQEQYFKILEGMRNIAVRIQRLENPSHPRHERFVTLCQEILGFKIGIIPVDQNGNGFEPGLYVDDTSMIPIKSMGEGVVNILGFIVTLLTGDDKLILVEELENDIHPTALKKLLSLIKEKSFNNQFVISTHSNIVLKYLGAVPESRIFFTETITDYKTSPIPTSKVTRIPNDPKSRMKVLERLGYEFNDFELFDAYLILEESSAERVIRDFLIPNFVPELYGRIRTIAARGVDDLNARISDFNRLFVFIHTSPIYYKRAWVVADGDQAGKDCIHRLKAQFKSWPSNHFLNFTKNNFEDFYPSRFKGDVASAFSLEGNRKQKAKESLITEVMDWALKNREDAVREFAVSASEVITLLKNLNKKLPGQKKAGSKSKSGGR